MKQSSEFNVHYQLARQGEVVDHLAHEQMGVIEPTYKGEFIRHAVRDFHRTNRLLMGYVSFDPSNVELLSAFLSDVTEKTISGMQTAQDEDSLGNEVYRYQENTIRFMQDNNYLQHDIVKLGETEESVAA